MTPRLRLTILPQSLIDCLTCFSHSRAIVFLLHFLKQHLDAYRDIKEHPLHASINFKFRLFFCRPDKNHFPEMLQVNHQSQLDKLPSDELQRKTHHPKTFQPQTTPIFSRHLETASHKSDSCLQTDHRANVFPRSDFTVFQDAMQKKKINPSTCIFDHCSIYANYRIYFLFWNIQRKLCSLHF